MRLRALVLALSLLTGFVATANAQQSVVVLGLRTAEGDDALALNLSQALRKAASEVPDWLVRDQSISLAQMVLVHGCDSVDLPCLGTIATGLAVDRLIFGDITHDSQTSEHNLQVELQMYSAKSGAIDGKASASFPSDPSSSVIADLARQLLTQAQPGAAGENLAPMLSVSSNVEGAEVRVNGQLIGQIQGGSLRLPDLQPGAYTVELSAIGYESTSKMVELASGEATTLDLNLTPTNAGTVSAAPTAFTANAAIDSDGPNVLPYALFGVSALGIAGMVTSWVIIDNVGNKKIYQRYRAEIDSVDDVCIAAEQGHDAAGEFNASEINQVVDVCNTASTFEVLQYVFAGVAAVAAISGAALLVVDLDDEPDNATASANPREPMLSIRPILGLDHGGLSAKLRF